jgi:hypothetical protein
MTPPRDSVYWESPLSVPSAACGPG